VDELASVLDDDLEVPSGAWVLRRGDGQQTGEGIVKRYCEGVVEAPGVGK
jgi:hypothetical protein